MITRIQPDTNSVGVRGKEFVIHFDEVVSEHPAGASSLDDLVLISPRDGAPVVDWHRSSISIRPRKGWRANTTYTVTVLPGISDLRGNIRTASTAVTFSTGPAIPHTSFSGVLFDWLTGLPVNTGMVEAHPLTDTTVAYVAASDSLGHYRMIGLPPARYAVRGYIDKNRNRALDPGEAFDTTHAQLTDTLSLELLAFAHDSAGPRLGSVIESDSVTLRAIFDTPLDPRVQLATTQFSLMGPDSARIAIVSVKPAGQDTTRATPVLEPVSQSAVPIPQRRPATSTVILPKPTRALLFRDVLIRIAKPLHPGSTYTLYVTNATGPTGRTLSSNHQFAAPSAPRQPLPPKPPARAPVVPPGKIPVKPAQTN